MGLVFCVRGWLFSNLRSVSLPLGSFLSGLGSIALGRDRVRPSWHFANGLDVVLCMMLLQARLT